MNSKKRDALQAGQATAEIGQQNREVAVEVKSKAAVFFILIDLVH